MRTKAVQGSSASSMNSRKPKSSLTYTGSILFVVFFTFLLLLLVRFHVSIQQGLSTSIRKREEKIDGEEKVPSSSSSSDWSLLGRTRNTEQILDKITRNGTSSCHNVTTFGARVSGLPDHRPVQISTDEIIRFTIISVTSDGQDRCAGGDYYEVDIEGDHWKSRPKIKDLEDGSYEVSFMIDGSKPGLYNFTARILFGNLHGLDHNTLEWRRDGEVCVSLQFLAQSSESRLISSSMRMCGKDDMVSAGAGGGRWTRGVFNKSCVAEPNDGRWRCLSDESSAKCESPWCSGSVLDLESNGWVYSDRECGFHIFTKEEAWECLSNRWLFMWGDSNMLDFLRNLLIFGLDYPPPSWANISTWEMNRVVEQPLFINPRRPDQAVRVSYIFNGHYETMGDWLGLDSLKNKTYREKLEMHFNGSAGHPDTFIFNSGLHDGLHFQEVGGFAKAVERAAEFWRHVMRPLTEKAGKKIRMLLRTTVAPAGPARWNKSNPQKMEDYNAILLEGFRKRFRGMQVIDAFDVTFPFHYDFNYSDGGHYGRPPGIHRWPWFDKPHHYFIEVMLVHMMLNSICFDAPSTTTVSSSS